MQLTGFTDLALRIMMRLAVLGEARSETTNSLAGQLDVSYAHAAKVVTALHKLGVIETRRGRTGGLRLAAGGESTSIGAIVRQLEPRGDVVECDGENPCPMRGDCRLRSALRQAQEAFFASLDPLSIADVVESPTRPVLLSLTARPGP